METRVLSQPQSVERWVTENQVRDEMLWKGGALRQFECFKALHEVLDCKTEDVKVVSHHTSKSIKLPVIQAIKLFENRDWGLRLRARDNFHNCQVSVDWEFPIEHDLWGICTGGNHLNPVYFEGFDSDWVYDGFYKGCTRFSASVSPGGEGLKLLCQVLKHVLFEGPKPDHERILKEEQARKDALALADPFPCVYWKDSITGKFRFFDPGHEVEVPSMKVLEDHIRWTLDSEYLREKNPDLPPKLLPYITLDFSAGCPQPVGKWLAGLSELVEKLRTQEGVDRLGDRQGSSVKVQGLNPELKNRVAELRLGELLREVKD